MELSKQEILDIKDILQLWETNPEIELEATFGSMGLVDQQSFLRVVQYLRSKGFESISHEDRLTVSVLDLSDRIRFTLSKSSHIARYCRDNVMADRPFQVMIKDRNISQDQFKKATIDLKDYDVRLKGRREIELEAADSRVVSALAKWSERKKFFRLIRRWTFKVPGLKFDLSMVRSTPMDKKTGVAMQYNFQDSNKPSLISLLPTYEIELELDRTTFSKDKTPDYFKKLIYGMGEVLRGIQGTPILIRNSTKINILKDYKELTKETGFRGVAPVTLEVKNMTSNPEPGVPNIRSGYNVTDKADGLRVHGFTTKDGELFMIDMAMNVYRTGLRNSSCADSLLDGEYVTQDKNGQPIQELLFFDIYYLDEKDVSIRPFKEEKGDTSRYEAMNSWIQSWNSPGKTTKFVSSASLVVALKQFHFATPNTTSIFAKATEVLNANTRRIYHTDGLIFTPNSLPLPDGAGVGFVEQFKWKPSEENSIDFLIKIVKEPSTKEDKVSIDIHPVTNQTIQYKTLHLFVGSVNESAFNDARTTLLNDLPLPSSRKLDQEYRKRKYKPVPFLPKEFPDPMAPICYLETQIDPKTNEVYVVTEKSNEPIRDGSIIEMRYNTTNAAGWRWIPIRVRTDKTERLLKGTFARTLNSEKTAESIWNSIHEPVTKDMITGGLDAPSEEEIAQQAIAEKPVVEQKKYFERKASKDDINKVSGLRNFHNRYIKDVILFQAISVPKGSAYTLLDLTVGKAEDLNRWRRANISFVLGVDIVDDNIRNTQDGAYRRLLNTILSAQDMKHADPIPTMFFAVGDSSLRLIDGSAGSNEQERDILRSILGRVEPLGPIPSAIQRSGKDVLKQGADVVSCMHSMHYFFENEAKFDGFLQNIADNLKVGGYYIGTNFDGEAVFNKLYNVETGKGIVGMDGDTILWEITKLYNAEKLPMDASAFGMAINVFFISIGMAHLEYLVPWEFFVAKMRSIGCTLLTKEELQQVGLQYSTNLYETSYSMAMKTREASTFRMSNSVKDFSFLYRWFIFKRTSEGSAIPGTIDQPVEETDRIPAAASSATSGMERIPDASATSGMERIPDASAAVQTALQTDQQSNLAALSKTIQSSESTTELIKSMVEGPGGIPDQTRTIAVREPFNVQKQTYAAASVFQIYEKSPELSKHITLPPEYAKYAARHMAPNAPWRIIDTTDSSDVTEYPSITHFLAGMKFKYASKLPDQAKVFSRGGTIHLSFLAQRQAEETANTKGISKERDLKLLELETEAVQQQESSNLEKAGFDITKWAVVKDTLLQEAIKQRLQNDKWFCIIVNAAITQNKYILYLDKYAKGGSELGGTYTITKTIQGENRYGVSIMTLAKQNPNLLENCLQKS